MVEDSVMQSGMANDVGSLDELCKRLGVLRTRAGGPSYTQIARQVGRLRAARGELDVPGRVTVYDCFRTGRTRLDAELVADVALVLGASDPDWWWRRACGMFDRQESSHDRVVAVTDQPPRETAHFTGRDSELARVHAALDGPATSVAAIVGMAGVGKTQVALRACHARRVERVLFTDLRGFSLDQEPADPHAVLSEMLRLLGVTAAAVARLDASARSDLFHARLADRPTVLLLDNAANAAQLRPLLPDIRG